MTEAQETEARERREAIARIIDPEAWRAFALHQAGAKRYVGIGGPVADELADHLIEASHDVTADSLAKADAILALSSSPLPSGGGRDSSNANSAAMGPQPHVAPEAEPSAETVWRVCHLLRGDCERCPPVEDMPPHGLCVRGCYMQAESCVNTVETGNPWRKTTEVRAPFVALGSPSPPDKQR